MTPDEARQVLTAARDTARYQRWQEVYDLVFPVHEEGVLDGEEQAELAFLIGDACQGLESWDAAAHYWRWRRSRGRARSPARRASGSSRCSTTTPRSTPRTAA
jgi:hypothetical protein